MTISAPSIEFGKRQQTFDAFGCEPDSAEVERVARSGIGISLERLAAQKADAQAISTGRLIYLVVFATFLVFSLIGLQPWVPPHDLIGDPLSVAATATECCGTYYGLVSNLGVMIWTGTAAICLFVAVAALAASARWHTGAFFASAGLITLWFGIDDLFMMHEKLLPALGIAGPVIHSAYVLLAVGYLGTFWREIFQARATLFAVAGAMLGASLAVETFLHTGETWQILLEDGLKFAGIVFWALFHASAALGAVSRWADRMPGQWSIEA